LNTARHYRILLIDQDLADAEKVRAVLDRRAEPRYSLESVGYLSAGIERLNAGQIDAVLLDLFLPDSQGLATFERLWQVAPDLPILIVCRPGDESLAVQALERGAQDYLLKLHLDSYSLRHALRNMIDRAAAAEALFCEKERAEVTLNSIGDAVLSTDVEGRITYLNSRAEQMTGWTREEAIRRPLTEVFRIVDGATREPAPNPVAVAVRGNKLVGLSPNTILLHRDGHDAGTIEDSTSVIRDRRGRVTGAVIVFHDVTVARAISQQMVYSAHHDALTDLPNRLLLNDRLSQAIESARRHHRRLGVLFLDVDRFKQINDSLGHDVGDQLLRSVARQLTRNVRSSDTVSRQGGDELVVVLPEIEHATDAAVIADKLLAATAEAHHIGGHEIHVTASIGISVYPDDGTDAITLLKHADIAMYHAKEDGRGRHQFFQPDMKVRVIERQSIEHGLRRALALHEFVLHYQPRIHLHTGEVMGVEALIRWKHPDRGLLPPTDFVSIAEDCGLIVPIGQWVLDEACRQSRRWQDLGLRPTPVAVNVSAMEFRGVEFLDSVRRTLERTRLSPRHLQLEMTESVLMAHGDSTVRMLRELKRLGVELALDDFGTGYSSLGYLKDFPIDALHVDGSFVREITDDLHGPPIVRAIISMAKSLNQRIVAEGIETAEQLSFLRAQDCSEGQGYYFGQPLPAAQFAKVLTTSAGAFIKV
jgi:diguanylate cyclase (GGDEF)-like protein/PAS domain S-box-containing protein